MELQGRGEKKTRAFISQTTFWKVMWIRFFTDLLEETAVVERLGRE